MVKNNERSPGVEKANASLYRKYSKKIRGIKVDSRDSGKLHVEFFLDKLFLEAYQKHMPTVDNINILVPEYRDIAKRTGVLNKRVNLKKLSSVLESLFDKREWEVALCLIISVNEFGGLPLWRAERLGYFMRVLKYTDSVKLVFSILKLIEKDHLPDYLVIYMIDYAIDLGEASDAEEYISVLLRTGYPKSRIDLYYNKIKRLRNISRASDRGYDLEELNFLSGEEFERLISSTLESYGCQCTSTSKSGDYGADILITDKSGTKFAIQCKRYKGKVNLKAVQEVVSSCAYYECDIGIVVTNGIFLKSAVELAGKNGVELWGVEEIIKLLAKDEFETELDIFS